VKVGGGWSLERLDHMQRGEIDVSGIVVEPIGPVKLRYPLHFFIIWIDGLPVKAELITFFPVEF
jgi:hypothetical protein